MRELSTSGIVGPPPSDLFGAPERPDTSGPAGPLLVCTECAIAYEYQEDWSNCPVCAEELLEVEKT